MGSSLLSRGKSLGCQFFFLPGEKWWQLKIYLSVTLPSYEWRRSPKGWLNKPNYLEEICERTEETEVELCKSWPNSWRKRLPNSDNYKEAREQRQKSTPSGKANHYERARTGNKADSPQKTRSVVFSWIKDCEHNQYRDHHHTTCLSRSFMQPLFQNTQTDFTIWKKKGIWFGSKCK